MSRHVQFRVLFNGDKAAMFDINNTNCNYRYILSLRLHHCICNTTTRKSAALKKKKSGTISVFLKKTFTACLGHTAVSSFILPSLYSLWQQFVFTTQIQLTKKTIIHMSSNSNQDSFLFYVDN